MPSFLLEFLKLTFELIGLFFVISFLVGVGQFFINPKSKIFTFSRNNKFLSACCGALLGGVTPFCSCSTIPLFVGFVKSKAPFSTSIAFLLASPIMNPAILTLMGVFFGIETAILYGLCTFIFAVLCGLVLEKFGFEKEIYDISITGGKKELQMWSELTGTFGRKLKTVIQTSIFNSLLLLRKVFPYLLVGTAFGALIHGLLPVSVVQKVAGIPAWFSVPAAALIGIPLYIRTETIIPMATVLQSVGLGPGVLVSLMIGGGGASLPEVSLLSSIFTKKMLAAFLISVFTVACATGFIFNSLLG
ncbi:MAG: permease [Turicimonas muris]|uniref:permease n=1 Tax=Turicimonas muris TaxID=1796652 RepID=UPI0025B655D3|nr:permease [Turicimonas muris]